MRAGPGAQGSSESLTELMEQLAVHFPTLTRPLIGERDEYMAFRLRMLAAKCGSHTSARGRCLRGPPAVQWAHVPCILPTKHAGGLHTMPQQGIWSRASVQVSRGQASMPRTCGSSPDAGLANLTKCRCGRASRVVAVVGAGHVPGAKLLILLATNKPGSKAAAKACLLLHC